MSKPLSPARRQSLAAALSALDGPQCQDRNATYQLAHLQAHHGARVTIGPTGNAISCAGVRATCTWSPDYGLLKAWRQLAVRRLAQAAQQGTPQASPVSSLSREEGSTGRTAPGTAQSGPGAPRPIGEHRHG